MCAVVPSFPRFPNQLAHEIVRISTEEFEEAKQPAEQAAIYKYLAQVGRTGGLKGEKARAAKLSARKRKEIAQLAVVARWNKKVDFDFKNNTLQKYSFSNSI